MVQDIIWKADCHSACQKNPAVLWDPKVHYRVHTNPSLDPTLSQLNPVRPIHPYLPKVHLNVILSRTPRSSQWSLALGPPNNIITPLSNIRWWIQKFPDWPPGARTANGTALCISHLSHPCYLHRQSHPPWFNYPNNIRWRIQAVKLLIMQSSPASRHYIILRKR
jgi:hypothetical protein